MSPQQDGGFGDDDDELDLSDLDMTREQIVAVQKILQTDGVISTKDLARHGVIPPETAFDVTEVPDAIDEYLRDIAVQSNGGTVDTHESRLGIFGEFCKEQGIKYLHEVDISFVKRYRDMRRHEDDIGLNTERSQMMTLRKFLRISGQYNKVDSDLAGLVPIPSPDPSDETRDAICSREKIRGITNHLRQFKYASREHVVLAIYGLTGCRTSGLRALDLEDIARDGDGQTLIQFENRPKSESRLKRGERSTRTIMIPDHLAELIEDYVEHTREDVTDEFGRKPLITTPSGRVSASTLQKYVYKWTRPCELTAICPNVCDGFECDGDCSVSDAYACPGSLSPHTIRRGFITHLLRENVPVEVISQYCDVSPEVIEKHYDGRSGAEKARETMEILRALTDESSTDLDVYSVHSWLDDDPSSGGE